MAAKKKNATFPVIKYFDHQGPKVVRVLCETTVSIFEHFVINTWKGIYQMWIDFGLVLKGLARTKPRKSMLTCKEIARYEAGYQWGLGEPEDVCS